MADAVKIELKGFKELEAALKSFGPRVAKNGLRSADFAGARVIRDAAKEAVPVDTGLLKSQIYAARRRTPDHIATYTIRVRNKGKVTKIRRFRKGRNAGKYTTAAPPPVYGKFLEFGTSRMAAKPWLRPALLQNVTKAIDAIKAGLAKAIAKAAIEKASKA